MAYIAAWQILDKPEKSTTLNLNGHRLTLPLSLSATSSATDLPGIVQGSEIGELREFLLAVERHMERRLEVP